MLRGLLRPSVSPLLFVSLSCAFACSQGESSSSNGGAPGTGGSRTQNGGTSNTASGGATNTGGSSTQNGGAPGSGGSSTQSGGAANNGGSSAQSGGKTGSGGSGVSTSGGGSAGGAANTGGGSAQSGGRTGSGGGANGGGNTGGASNGGSAGSGNPPPACTPTGKAHNPMVTQIFTADPNAVVYKDKIYVYTSHDVDGQTGFDMVDYHAFSSDDMVNWQDHGIIIQTSDLNWATNLYAPGACTKNGKYYLYIPNSGSAIGVAVSDNPGGPFVDPIKKALVTKSFPNANVPWLFDPACFVDDDGQGYLYFGGGDNGGQNARVIRLNDDMISLKDSMATTIPTTAFFEASFMHKYDGKYYFSYSSDFSSGHGAALEYLIGDSPMSGFKYQGKLLNNASINNGNNNHGSIVNFGGKNYVFYHNRKLQQELGVNKVNNRSVAVQELTYAADGKINTVSMSTDNYTVSQLKCLDAFVEVEAERLAEEHGTEVEGRAGTTVRVAKIDSGDWVAYSQVNFRDGATKLVAKVAAASAGGKIDVLVDGCIGGKKGTSIGTCDVTATGSATTFAPISCTLTKTSGAHDLCLSFSGSSKFELDSFHLE